MLDPEAILKKINILVVDDMEVIRNMVCTCLKELGAEHIFIVEDGAAAWNKINNRRIDLIICDWDMPVVTGLELLQTVRKSRAYRKIPFLMLTATYEKEKVITAIKAGVDEYVMKPFQIKDLEYRIIKILRKVDVR